MHPEHPRRRFVLLLLITAGSAAFVAPWWSLLPAYVEKALERPPSVTGALYAVSMITAGFLYFLGGAAADSLGSRRTMLVGLAGLGVAGFFFVSTHLAVLFGLSLLIGLGNAFHTTGAMSYLMRAVSEARMGVGAGFFFVSMTLGMALGSLIFGPLADYWGYRPMGWIMVGGMAVMVVLGWTVLPEAGAAHTEHQSLREMVTGYRALMASHQVRWLLGVRFLPTCMWGAASVAFPYLLFVASGKNQVPAFYATTSMVMAACAQMLTGKFCDRFGLRVSLRGISLLIPVTTLLTAMWADSVAGLWIFGILYTCAAWALSTTMPALMNTVSEVGERGRIVGATHVAWAAGMAIGQIGAGWLLTVDPAACFYAGTVLCAASVFCAWKVT